MIESVLHAFLLSKTEHNTSTRIEVTRNSASKPCSGVILGCTKVKHVAQQVPFRLCSLSTLSGVIVCNKEDGSCVDFWEARLTEQQLCRLHYNLPSSRYFIGASERWKQGIVAKPTNVHKYMKIYHKHSILCVCFTFIHFYVFLGYGNIHNCSVHGYESFLNGNKVCRHHCTSLALSRLLCWHRA